MTTERRGDWMQTYTGRAFWPLDPRDDEIDIVDIAHALSLQCRFAGHCLEFYSVAEHSVRVAREVAALGRNQLSLAALLHDAAEAYLVDLPRPIKRASEMGVVYSLIEEQLAIVIERRFDLPRYAFGHGRIKHADNVLLATEARDLMSTPPRPWMEMPPPLDEVIVPVSPGEAERVFLMMFDEFGGVR